MKCFIKYSLVLGISKKKWREQEAAMHRLWYRFLYLIPFFIIPIAGARPLRVGGLYQTVGLVLFGLIAIAIWRLWPSSTLAESQTSGQSALSGALLVLPFAFIALLWVGLGTPWDATHSENTMRYSVLLVGSVSVTCGFALLKEVLSNPGHLMGLRVGATLNLLAGSAYLIWFSFQLGSYAETARGTISESLQEIGNVFDTLLFVACGLTYLTTAIFAHAMGQQKWIGKRASRAFIFFNLIAFTFLCIRGLSFPDPRASSTPWFMRPGFVAGIPAMPWVMPFLLGVLALRGPKAKGPEG